MELQELSLKPIHSVQGRPQTQLLNGCLAIHIQGSWYPIDRPPASKDYFEGGIMHMQSVTFAVKEKFEKQVIKGNVTVNFLDQSEMEMYRDLAKKLKEQSKYKTSSQ